MVVQVLGWDKVQHCNFIWMNVPHTGQDLTLDGSGSIGRDQCTIQAEPPRPTSTRTGRELGSPVNGGVSWDSPSSCLVPVLVGKHG